MLSELGQRFFEKRRDYMAAHNKGMTKFYNDFHDAALLDDEIRELREIQIQINEEVLAAYPFDGISLQHNFHQVGYLPKGKNARFTISESARDELLYRLAMLNKSRSEKDAAAATPNTRTPGLRRASKSDRSLDDLLPEGEG